MARSAICCPTLAGSGMKTCEKISSVPRLGRLPPRKSARFIGAGADVDCSVESFRESVVTFDTTDSQKPRRREEREEQTRRNQGSFLRVFSSRPSRLRGSLLELMPTSASY